MTKKISWILFLTLILPLLFIPVSAEETITDLTKVHTNLSTYLYTPYYEDSQYYDDYADMMEEVGELLESDAITQAEISKYYNELRTVYSRLMQDSYDYTPLNGILQSYEALDSSIFTEESWKKLLSVRDAAQKELEAPSLFTRTENMTAKQYAAYTERHIASFSADFSKAFNSLVMIEKPEPMTKEYLMSYSKYIRFCAREDLLSKADAWADLQAAFADSDYAIGLENPKQSRLDDAFAAITNSYKEACNQAYDFTKAKEAITKYHVLTAQSFAADSWNRYADAIGKLEEKLNAPHFFYIPIDGDTDTNEEYAEAYLSALPAEADQANAALIPIEDYNRLTELCEKNKNKTSIEGLEIKLGLLLTRVKEGEAVLADVNATKEQVKEAISNIEDASNDLIMAEGYLIEEQEKVVKQDAKTTRFTVIFTVTSLLLSAIFAMVLSRHYFGKVNWTK